MDDVHQLHQLHNTIKDISQVWMQVMCMQYSYKLNKWELSWDDGISEMRIKCTFIELPCNNTSYFLCKDYLDVPLWLLDASPDDVKKYFEQVQ